MRLAVELHGTIVVADTLQRHTPETNLRQFARHVVLAAAIGNLDMHTKNIGLLHSPDGEVGLAPAYDVVPHAHRDNDGRLALAVNGIYDHARVTAEDLSVELSAWGLRRGAQLARSTLEELEAALSDEDPMADAHPSLAETVEGFVRNLLAGNSAGVGG